MNVVLANRIVAGAEAGRLVLTLAESADLLDYLAVHPRATVIVRGAPVEIRLLPAHVLDPVEDRSLDYLSDLDEPDRSHLSSWAEGLLDVDDVRRLLRW